MNLNEVNVSYYNMALTGYSVTMEAGLTNLEINAVETLMNGAKYTELLKDVSIMNEVRLAGPGSAAYSVYEQLLTTLALTK